MRCLAQLVEDALPIVIEIDAGDLLTRNHDVVHRDPLKVENTHQHLLVTARDHQTRFGDDGAQLFAR